MLFGLKYGKCTPLAVHRVPKHEYLGMNVDVSESGKVRITIFQYIMETLDESPPEFTGTSATSAGLYLFNTSNNTQKIDDMRAGMFHHITAKLLYLSKRARPNIQLAVFFLCARVRAPEQQDRKKMGRVIRYLRGTQELHLTLEADITHLVKSWADDAFAVTEDMKSHWSGTMPLGQVSN